MSVIVLSTDEVYELYTKNQNLFSWLSAVYLRYLCCRKMLPVDCFPITRQAATTLGEQELQRQFEAGILGSVAYTRSVKGVRLLSCMQATVTVNKQSVSMKQRPFYWVREPALVRHQNNTQARLMRSMVCQLVRQQLRALSSGGPVVRETPESRAYHVNLLRPNGPCLYLEVEDAQGIISTKVRR